jgi:hypothetical protein
MVEQEFVCQSRIKWAVYKDYQVLVTELLTQSIRVFSSREKRGPMMAPKGHANIKWKWSNTL